jgi:predicted nucleic acid-binding protein
LPDVICNTSPLQYLHQLGQLESLHTLAGKILVPLAVADELAAGQACGVDVPDLTAHPWITIRQPLGGVALRLVTDLGPGETAVLALALEIKGAVTVLDDGLARRVGQTLGTPLTGTLGILLDAKRAGLITAVEPLLDKLQALRFRLSASTRAAVLKLAGEAATP